MPPYLAFTLFFETRSSTEPGARFSCLHDKHLLTEPHPQPALSSALCFLFYTHLQLSLLLFLATLCCSTFISSLFPPFCTWFSFPFSHFVLTKISFTCVSALVARRGGGDGGQDGTQATQLQITASDVCGQGAVTQKAMGTATD